MCIAILSTSHPEYPLILLNNRDEFLNRPTAPADWWAAPNQHVLGGRDLERKEQGTWLAISRQGRLAVLTNFREEGVEITRNKSRGGIVNAFLTANPEQQESPSNVARRLIEDVGVQDVGGFSLIFGELRAPSKDGERPPLSILSNRSASADTLTSICSGADETRGLSNSHFGDTSWPKVVHGEEFLRQAIHGNVERGESQRQLLDVCFGILSIDTLPRHEEGQDWTVYVRQMRNSILIPPLSGDTVEQSAADKLASAPKEPDTAVHEQNAHGQSAYGTQKQTVVLVNRDGLVTFVERTLFVAESSSTKHLERHFEFAIEGWNS